MDPAQVAIIGGQMCRALSAAHRKGIVHRDLKPHNVQLVPKSDGRSPGEDPRLRRRRRSWLHPTAGESVKTRTGSLMGTPLYMSPEQCKGAGTLDHRTDIYSLGVMLFEMLAGRPPFVAEGVGELFAKHMLREPPQLGERCPQVPRHVAAAVMKSLAKEPGDRFQSMDEFRNALVGELELLAERSTGGRTTDVHVQGESVPPTQRWRVMALVGALATAGAVGLHALPKTQSAVAVAAPMPSRRVVPPARVTAEVVSPSVPPVVEAVGSAPRADGEEQLSDGRKRVSARRRARRVERVIDEDGLATPSF